MLKTKVIKGVLGVSAVAALFAALAVQAQSGAGTSPGATPGATGVGQTGAGQSTGQTGTSTSGQTAGQSGSQAGMQSGTQASGATASGAGASTLSRADQKMIKDMAMANLSEIESARMAQRKSQSEQVKNFAQQMIDDHTKALGEVQQLAQAKGVALPTELDRTHKRKAERMAALSGEAFDRAYMEQAGVADHKRTHGLLQQAQARAKDPDLKALAARTQPIVDQHLNSAQQLHKNTARGGSQSQGKTGSSSGTMQGTGTSSGGTQGTTGTTQGTTGNTGGTSGTTPDKTQ